jgi:hypothetical protein
MKNNKHSEKWKVHILILFMVSPLKLGIFFFISSLILTMVNATSAILSPFDGSKISLSENTTLLHPLINQTKGSSTAVDINDPSVLDKLPWYCLCSNELLENENESECCCQGPMFTKIPQKMPLVTRLLIENAKFKVLREAGLKRYSPNLRDM